MTAKTARQFQQEIVDWQQKHRIHPDKIGYIMAARLGDYCHKQRERLVHCTPALKGRMDQVAIEHTLGLCMVELLSWTQLNDTFISFGEVEEYLEFISVKRFSEPTLLGLIYQVLGSMVFYKGDVDAVPPDQRTSAQRMMNYLCALILVNGYKPLQLLQTTWDHIING